MLLTEKSDTVIKNNSHFKDMQVVASNITFRLPGQTRFSCTKLRDMCMMNLLNDIMTLWKQCLHICTHIVPGTAKQITDFSLNCKLAQTSSLAVVRITASLLAKVAAEPNQLPTP